MGEECFACSFAHLPRMALIVKQAVAANPLHLSFFSAVGVVLETNRIPHLIQQFLRRWLHRDEQMYCVSNSTSAHLRKESEIMRKDARESA